MIDIETAAARLDERPHENWLDFMTHCAEIAGYHVCAHALAFESDDGNRRIELYELDRALMHAPAQVVITQLAQP